ncbi:hypothetical protein IL306_012007, partial [Fusarium sp. DS 682]
MGTSAVDVYPYELSPNRTVYLIDTPGFDDTTGSDTQVLDTIATWFGESYRNKTLLHGIIYLHRITDIRMQGSAKRNLLLFKQLCGQDALKKVILATTMWDKVLSEEGARREEELINTPEFWGWMLEKGSSCHRHSNTVTSARQIVHKLANHNTPIATDLQKQLVDDGLELGQTSAGKELQSELLKEREKWAKERRDIEVQMNAALKKSDYEAQKALEEERDRYGRMVKMAEGNIEALRSTMENLIAQRDQQVSQLKEDMKKQQTSFTNEINLVKRKQLQLEQEKNKLEKEIKQRRGQGLKQALLKKNEAVALFNFDADQPGDLGFKKGEVITILKRTKSDNDW